MIASLYLFYFLEHNITVDMFEYISETDLQKLTVSISDRCLFKKGLNTIITAPPTANNDRNVHKQRMEKMPACSSLQSPIKTDPLNKSGNISVEKWVSYLFVIKCYYYFKV